MQLITRGLALAATLTCTACWHSRPPEPARWQGSGATAELLPDGAWLVGGADFDVSASAVQKAAEDKVRSDPSSVKQPDGGCTIPAQHAAFAVYDSSDFAFVTRGVFAPDAMLACVAEARRPTSKVSRATVAGHDVLVTQVGSDAPVMYAASETGLLVLAQEPTMTRLLAPDLRPATGDPRMRALVAQARAGGEIWAAGRIPRDAAIVKDVLSALKLELAGHVVTVVASIHLAPPFKIALDLELEQEADAKLVASTLEHELQWLRGLDQDLEPAIDSLAVHADGTHVQVIGHPAQIDWLQAFRGVLAAVSVVQSQLGH